MTTSSAVLLNVILTCVTSVNNYQETNNCIQLFQIFCLHINAFSSATCVILSLLITFSLLNDVILFPDYNDQSSHTSVIREHYMFLLETLDVKFSGLVGHLYSKEVLSAVERDDITAEMTSFRANEKLLSALSRKSPQQFQLFLDALDNCGQRHVRNVISPHPPGFR